MKDTITEGLSTARRKLSQLKDPELYRIEVEPLAKELDLENEARKLAAAGLPTPDQTALTAAEAKTVQRIETARQDYVRWAGTRLNTLNEDLARRDVTVLVNDALAADKAFDRRAASTVSEHGQLVHELAERATVRCRELEDFRTHHRINRPATYPEGSATFARYAVLLALIVVEGVANAYFFSQGLESGLIGGFLAAGLFAAVNLITAFVIGKYAIPLLFHRNPALIVLGTAAAIFAVAWMITIGLTIAHFRDALTADAAEPARAAWAAVKATPFDLRDVMSWLLFSISVLFAVFALFDGVSSDDRYPGYGAVARRAQESRDDYLGELQQIRSNVEEIKTEALAELDGNMQKARTFVTESQALVREKKWIRTQLETALLDAENCLDTLLKIFRDANQMSRGSLPPPPYFESRPTLQKLVLPDFGLDEDRARLEAQERSVEQLVSQADHLRGRIEAAFASHTEQLKPEERRLLTMNVRPQLVGSGTRQR